MKSKQLLILAIGILNHHFAITVDKQPERFYLNFCEDKKWDFVFAVTIFYISLGIVYKKVITK